MAVNSINLAMSATSYGAYNQKLTKQTQEELTRLGIVYDPNISERQGRLLIQKAKTQEAQKENQNNNSGNQNKNDLFEKAKELASQLGIKVDENIDFNSLLSAIEQAIELKVEQSQNNPEMLKKLKTLGEELAFIQAQSTGSMGFNSSNHALEKSLEMLSLYNQNYYLNR